MPAAHDAGVAVIGAGVIGLACAERLAAAGCDVLVLDAGAIGHGATGAALGALMPHAPTAPTPLADAQLASLAAMPDWIAAIEARSGIATAYRRVGRIEILSSPRAAAQADAKIAAAQERWAALSDRDSPLHRIAAADARAAMPAVAAAPHGYLAEDVTAQIDPTKLLAGLAGACRASGARVLDHAPVRTLDPDEAGVTLHTVAGTLRTGHAVLATGIGVPEGGALADLPIRAVKGEAMRLPGLGDAVPRPVVTGPGGFALTRTDGLAVGSTSDRTAPIERTVTRDGLHALMGRARKLLAIDPATCAPLLWSGFRPAAPDGQPVIGPHPTHPRVVLALGHFKTGLSLAPGTAMAITAIIAGRTPDAPWRAFDPARFAGGRPDAGNG